MLRSAAFIGDEMLKFYLYPRKFRYGEGRQGSVFNISRGFISLCSGGTDGFVWRSQIAVLLFPATSWGKMSKIPPSPRAAAAPSRASPAGRALRDYFTLNSRFSLFKVELPGGVCSPSSRRCLLRDGRNWGRFGLGPPYLCLIDL